MPSQSQSQSQQQPQQPAQQHLDFTHSLRSTTHTELVKRLKQLHSLLRDFDQELIVTQSLDKVAKDLIHPSLLLHKDKGVKAYVGACLVDVLRLYAPDAPYTQAELKDLFDFLIRQFRAVGNPQDPHQAEYFYIVDSLASVKSIVIICDLDGSDELVERVFKESFDTISSSSPKNVEIALSDVLLSILEELPSVPAPVTDILTSQFLPKAIKARPSAFRLAVEVCRGASDKLQRYVSQYFAETIMATLEGREGSDDEEDDDEDDESSDDGRKRKGKGKKGANKKTPKKTPKKTSKKGSGVDDSLPEHLISAHDLIRSLHKHCPSLLLSVIPQLEAELVTTTSASYRRLATSVLGAMFSEGVPGGGLAKEFPGTWREWCKRAGDRESKVRVQVAERCGKIWREHPELGGDIEGVLLRLLQDPDEKVRLAAVSVFRPLPPSSSSGDSSSSKKKYEMDYETASHHVSRRVLEAVGGRVGDKKERVRVMAGRTLGRLWGLGWGEIESRDEHALKQFGWIPETLLDALKFSGVDYVSTRHLIDTLFSTYILPLPSTEKDAADPEILASWVDKFLVVERGIRTQEHRAALWSLTRLGEGRRGKKGTSVWEGYLTACERWNSGIIDDKDQAEPIKDFLKQTIKAIASQLPDPTKASEDLMVFAKQNITQMYRELKVLMDPQTELKTFVKNERDFLRRLEKFPSPTSSLQTFTSFIRLSTLPYISRSSIPQLLKRLTSGSLSTALTSPSHATEADQFAAAASRTLEVVSRGRAGIYKAHLAELGKVLGGEGREDGVYEAVLKALAGLKKGDEGVAIDGKFSKRALHFAKEGTEKQAKYAATIVALDKGRAGTVDDLVDHLSTALSSATDDELVPHLAALGRIARYNNEALEATSEAITTAALEVLYRAKASETPDDEDISWLDDAELHPFTRARVLSIKLLVNRCLAFAATESAVKVAKPVFELLWGMLKVQGGTDDNFSAPVASRVRLAAALSLLKLLASGNQSYVKQIVANLDQLSRVTQDPCFEVREQFIKKLLVYLREKRFHPGVVPRLNMILFLIAHEPEDELKEAVVNYATTRGRKIAEKDRQLNWEAPFLRLLHLLAHHPDYEGDQHDNVDEIKNLAKYLELYFDIFASAENVGYLYYLASTIKTVQDRMGSEYDATLYLLSELSQHLLKATAKRHNWPISTYPGKVVLPADIFKKFDKPEQAKKVASKTYIDEALLAKLEVKVEKKKSTTRKRVSPSNATGGSKPKKPRVSTKSSASSKPRKSAGGGGKKKDEWDSDEDQPASSSSSSDEDEDEDGDGAEEEESDDGGDGTPAPKKGGKKGAAPSSSRSRGGQRGNLRSDPKKRVVKGLGQSSGEENESGSETEAAAMEVDGASSVGEKDEDQGAETKGKGKKKAASPSSARKPAAATTGKSPAKKTTPAAATPTKGKKAPAAAAKKGDKKKTAAEKKKEEKEAAASRGALKGLKQPRALKKNLDIEQVSELEESGDEEEDEAMASGGEDD